MSKHLIKVEETWRADSEAEAAQLINEAKSDGSFELAKYSSTRRTIKQKGEIVEEYMRVSLLKVFDEEKKPVNDVKVSYEVTDSFLK